MPETKLESASATQSPICCMIGGLILLNSSEIVIHLAQIPIYPTITFNSIRRMEKKISQGIQSLGALV